MAPARRALTAIVICLPVGPRCDLCDLGEAKICPSRKSVVATSSPRSSPAKSRGTIRPKSEFPTVAIALEEGTTSELGDVKLGVVDPEPPQLAIKVEAGELDGQRIEGVVKVETDDAPGPTEMRIVDGGAKVEEVTTSW